MASLPIPIRGAPRSRARHRPEHRALAEPPAGRDEPRDGRPPGVQPSARGRRARPSQPGGGPPARRRRPAARWTAETLRRICARTGDDERADRAHRAVRPAARRWGGPGRRPDFLAIAGPERPRAESRLACGLHPRRWRQPARSSRPRTSHSRRARSRTPRGCSAPTRPVCSRPRPPGTSTAGSRRSASARRRSGPGSRALRTRLSERMAAAADGPAPGSRERAAPLFGRLARGLATVRALAPSRRS